MELHLCGVILLVHKIPQMDMEHSIIITLDIITLQMELTPSIIIPQDIIIVLLEHELFIAIT